MKEVDIIQDPVVILRESVDKGPHGEWLGILSVKLNGQEFTIHPEEPVITDEPTALGALPGQIETGLRIAKELRIAFALIEQPGKQILNFEEMTDYNSN